MERAKRFYNNSKIKNLFLLGICYMNIFCRLDSMMNKMKFDKILVVQPASMGDMICSTPVFRAIKKKYPDCHLTVAGNKLNKELLESNEDIDEYLVLKKDNLIRRNDDIAILLLPSFMPLVYLYFSDVKKIIAPRIVGYCPTYTKTYALLSLLVKTKWFYIRTYMPKNYLALLMDLDIFTLDTTKHLSFESDIRLKKPTIAIAPSAGNQIKMWSAKKFAKVADEIYKDYDVIILGIDKDKPQIDKMISYLNKKTKVINAYNKYTIDELKTIIYQLKLLIGNDTGLIYIAEAMNVPTIDILGAVDANDQPPRKGNFHQVVKVDRKESELYVLNARRYNEAELKRQINGITVDMVLDKYKLYEK